MVEDEGWEVSSEGEPLDVWIAIFVDTNGDVIVEPFRDKDTAYKRAVFCAVAKMGAWWKSRDGYALEDMRAAHARGNWKKVFDIFRDYGWERRLGVKVSVERRKVT